MDKPKSAKYLVLCQGKVWNSDYETVQKILPLEYDDVTEENILKEMGMTNTKYSSSRILSIQFLTVEY